ncbi:MAG: hypothetical protein HY940_06705 [Gammaproteobacteria bacterium]|nr:hypothetical protein [Gammaproteobacteria bacterium]
MRPVIDQFIAFYREHIRALWLVFFAGALVACVTYIGNRLWPNSVFETPSLIAVLGSLPWTWPWFSIPSDFLSSIPWQIRTVFITVMIALGFGFNLVIIISVVWFRHIQAQNNKPRELTPEEVKEEQAAEDALYKHVFDSLRNLFICVALIAAGFVVMNFKRELTPADISTFNAFAMMLSGDNEIFGVLVIISASALFIWNMIYSIDRIFRPFKNSWKFLLILPVFSLYVCLMYAVFFVMADFQRNQQNNSPHNPAFERDCAKARSPSTSR